MSKKSSEVDDNLKNLILQDKRLKSHIELEIRDKNRLETFVDGVFAIAITLLVFRICCAGVTTFQYSPSQVFKQCMD
ncbi:MAG: TMEM175 family protein [Methanobacterium sp.]|uniref:TMEM175 family protein n=1 Tax=Methanobacterium sp. TaxID=2164 RepID=UPI003C71AB4B